MLLAIDVGNTNIVLGVFDGDRLVESWRLATLRERTADEIGIWVAELFQHRAIDIDRISGIVMASVVAPLTGTLMTMAPRYVGLVDGLVRRMTRELGGHTLCVATGGLASVISPEVDLIAHVDPDLTLQGLRLVWERNRPS